MFEGIAQLIGDGSISGLTYSEAGASTVFLNRMPSSPDNAVCVYTQQGDRPDSLLPYDPVQFQIVVRGEPDGVWAIATGRAIYAKLHGLRNTTLPDGSYAAWVLGQSASPFSVGDDENGRPQFSWDYQGEELNPTAARPAL